MNNGIKDDIHLLDALVQDMNRQPAIHQPGPFWLASSRLMVGALKRYGLSRFRGGREATPGHTFTDAPALGIYDLDLKYYDTFKGRIKRRIVESFLFRRLFLDWLHEEVRSTGEGSFKSWLPYRDYWYNNNCSVWLAKIASEYTIPETKLGDCINIGTIAGQEIGVAYLGTLARIFNFADEISFDRIRSVLIIGGGFGYEAHLLMSLFPNIRKCLSVDVPPMSYVQTQYLKSCVQGRVIDYIETRHSNEIAFTDSDELEILNIAPWQMEHVRAEIDLCWNSCSFQEMTKEQIMEYARFALRTMDGVSDPRHCFIMYNARVGLSHDAIMQLFDGWSFRRIAAERKALPPQDEQAHYIGERRG